jgi:hypothetical protein
LGGVYIIPLSRIILLDTTLQYIQPDAIKAAGPVLVSFKRNDEDAGPDKPAVFSQHLKEGLEKLFQELLEKPVDKDAKGAPKSKTPQEDMEERISKLTLMDTDILEAQLAAERLSSSLERELQYPVDCLTIRLEKILGYKIEREINPLRAKQLTMLYRQSCDQLLPTKIASDVAMKNWGDLLKSTYPDWIENLNQYLVKQHVLPHLDRDDVTKRYQKKDQEKAREMRQSLITEITGQPPGDNSQVSDVDLMRSIHKLLAEAANDRPEMSKHVIRGSSHGPQASTEDVLTMLSQVSKPTLINEETGYRELTGQEQTLAEQIMSETALQSRSLDEQTQNSISLLSMMFDSLQQEEQIADAIKPLISELQLPILKMAVSDPGFFSNPDNPAQELVNEIAKAGTHWTPKENISRDPFYKKISSIVGEISSTEEDHEGIFEEKLHTLKEFLEKEERRTAILEERIIKAEYAASRTESARKSAEQIIAKKIRQFKAQPHTEKFLQDYWTQVIFFYINRDDEEESPEQIAVIEFIDSLLVVTPENPDIDIDKILDQLVAHMHGMGLDMPDQQQRLDGIRVEMQFLQQQVKNTIAAAEAKRLAEAEKIAAEKAAAAAEEARLQAAAEAAAAAAESAKLKAAAEQAAAERESARLKAIAEQAAAEQASAKLAAEKLLEASEKAAAEQAAIKLKKAAEQAAAEQAAAAEAAARQKKAAEEAAARLQAAAELAAAEQAAAKKMAHQLALVRAKEAEIAAAEQAAAEKAAAEEAAREANLLDAANEETETDTDLDDVFSQKVDQFRTESWFKLTNEKSEKTKIKLAAIIKHNGTYIFVNREGIKVITTKKPGVVALLRSGELEIVDDAVFFDRALESVIHSLRR